MGVRRALGGLVLAAAVLPGGCKTIGPVSVPRDRVGYNRAIADSIKEQTILNIVALRYGDPPVLVDVSSVISSYENANQVSMGLNIQDNPGASTAALGGSTTYAIRPTITYTPVVGEKLSKQLLSPIPPPIIFSMLNSGYPADKVLGLTVRSINGVFNRSRFRDADPQFPRLMRALRTVQQAEGLHMQIERRGTDEANLIMLRKTIPPEIQDEVQIIRDTLKIRPGASEYQLTLGTIARADNEIAVQSRSMLDILIELSTVIEVPPEDIEQHRTFASPKLGADETESPIPVVEIHWSDTRPPEAFAAVQYRGRWAWVDDRDLESKRILLFLIMFFSLAETGITPQVPVVTVPAH